jgi:hypothetical protein
MYRVGGGPVRTAWQTQHDCTNGDACYNLSCAFYHAAGDKRPGLVCKSDDNCWNPKCNYHHTAGNSRPGLHAAKGGTRAGLGICRFGNRCTDPGCVFAHVPQSQFEYQPQQSFSRTSRDGRGDDRQKNRRGGNKAASGVKSLPPSSYLSPPFTDNVLMLDLRSPVVLEAVIDAKFQEKKEPYGPDFVDFWKSHLMCEVQAEVCSTHKTHHSPLLYKMFLVLFSPIFINIFVL